MIWQFHQFIFTPTAHNETAQNSHVRHPWHCVSTTAHPDVSSQPKEVTCSSTPESTIMLNKFPDSSDGVSDLLQNRQGPHALDLFALFVRLVRFHLDSPSLGVHTRIRSTTLDSHVLVCHNGCSSPFRRGQPGLRCPVCPPQKHLSVLLRVLSPLPLLLPLWLEKFDRFTLTAHFLEMPSLATIVTLDVAPNDTSTSHAQGFPQQAPVDTAAPISIGMG